MQSLGPDKSNTKKQHHLEGSFCDREGGTDEYHVKSQSIKPSPGRELNRDFPEYDAGVLTIQPR
jgi:hypothetical protein